ncbi:hypothetical protein JE939_002858 [Yersinia ruckeri]|nr:hypothetical protein [Yersinia ruckeri]
MARLSFERRKLLSRTADALSVAYDDLGRMSPDDVRERIEGGDITVSALAYATGLSEEEIIEEAVKQAKKRERD